MDDNAEAKRIMLVLPRGYWRRLPGCPPHHMAKHHPARPEMSQSHTPWSSWYGSESPSVEVAVDVRRYAILSCMPETNELCAVIQSVAGIYDWLPH